MHSSFFILHTLLFALAHANTVRFALCYEKRTFVAERDRTEKRMWAERQPHRRNELFARVQQLNEQISKLR